MGDPHPGDHHREQAGTLNGLGDSVEHERRDDPVSYTHLRAHETVLDLVCRLLLEKKKNTKEQHIETSYTLLYD